METFQNVDEWLVSSTDVSSVLASCWMEAEPVPGLDDDDNTSYLRPACIADDFGCYDITDCLNSPVQSIRLCFNLISMLFAINIFLS